MKKRQQILIDFVSEVIDFDQHYCVVSDCDFDSLYELQQLTLGQMQNHKLEFISNSLLDKVIMKQEQFQSIFINPFCGCQNNSYVQKNIDKVIKQNLNISDSIIILFPVSHKNQIYKILQTLDMYSFNLQYIYSKDKELQYQILIIGKLVEIPTYCKLDSIYEYLLDDGINASFYDKMCVREVLAKLEPKISVQNILKILQKEDQSIRTIQNKHIDSKDQKKKLILFLHYIFQKNLLSEDLKQKMITQGLLEAHIPRSQTQLNLQYFNARQVDSLQGYSSQEQKQELSQGSQEFNEIVGLSDYSDFDLSISD